MLTYILLISDSKSEHDFFQAAINAHTPSFRLLSAYTGKSGVYIYQKIKPAVTFINFRLPDMDGLKCLAKIQWKKPSAGKKIFICDPHYNEELTKRAATLGATAWLSKWGPDKLNAFLYTLLEDGTKLASK